MFLCVSLVVITWLIAFRGAYKVNIKKETAPTFGVDI